MKEERVVAFSGPRNMKAEFAPLIFEVVDQVIKAKRKILIGCASGLDWWVRRRCEQKQYPFDELNIKDKCEACEAGALLSGNNADGKPAGTCEVCHGTGCKYGTGKSSFVLRSMDMINRMLVLQLFSGEPSTLISFPNAPCPDGILPAEEWTSGEKPSGTWSTLAYAIGQGLNCIVFPCHRVYRERESILSSVWPYAWMKMPGKSPWNEAYTPVRTTAPGEARARMAEIIDKGTAHDQRISG